MRSDLQTQDRLFKFDPGNSGDSASGSRSERPLLAAFDNRSQLVEGRDRRSGNDVEATIFLKGRELSLQGLAPSDKTGTVRKSGSDRIKSGGKVGIETAGARRNACRKFSAIGAIQDAPLDAELASDFSIRLDNSCFDQNLIGGLVQALNELTSLGYIGGDSMDNKLTGICISLHHKTGACDLQSARWIGTWIGTWIVVCVGGLHC